MTDTMTAPVTAAARERWLEYHDEPVTLHSGGRSHWLVRGDLIFADLDQYLVIEKGGVDRAMSIHVEFLTDQSVFRWTVRNNGQPIPRSAITPAKGSNTQSPFVALQTRS